MDFCENDWLDKDNINLSGSFFFHVVNNWHIFRIQNIFYKFIKFMSLSWSVMVGIIKDLVDLWSLFPNKKCK